MKNSFLQLRILILFVFSSLQIFSQGVLNKETVLKNVTESSKLIFEGKIIKKSKSFRAKNNVIYTSFDVQLDKVLHGTNPGATITLIVEGGEVEENGMLVGTATPHGLQLTLNTNSTIFCQPFGNGEVPNSYLAVEQVVYNSKNEIVVNNGLSEYYKNINDLYADLSKQLNIHIAEKKSLDVSENAKSEDVSLISYSENLSNYNNHISFFTTKQNNSITNQTAKVLANDLTISTGNEQITVTGTTRYLEFDVFARANTSGLYFDNCLMRIQYNSASFGSNMMASGNVTITKGTLFNSATYINPQTNAIDQTSNTLGIPFGIDYTQSTFNRTILTTTDKVLLHIKLKIQNCGQTSDLQFVDVSTTANLSFYTNTANASAVAGNGFDNTNYISPATNVLCTVIVDDFNSPVNGGTGNILTITGSNFGATRGNGQVRFKNSNAVNFPFLAGLDNNDYLSWSDTQIKIKLPSSTILGGYYNNPGSGPFIVKNNLGDSAVALYNASFTPLTIPYSVDSRFNTPDKYKLNLKNANGIGGYSIRLDTSISNHPDRKGCVLKAIRDWRCLSAVNLVLGNDLNYIPPANDGNTTISLVPSLPGSQVGSTFVQYQQCTAGGITNAITDFDTQVSTQYNLFYDTTGAAMPAGMYDFYEIMVHEIGHGLGLIHVIDTNLIMYRTTKVATNGISLAGSLRRRLTIYSGDADGGLYQVTSSSTNVNGQCSNFTSHSSVNSSCSQVGIYENLKNMYDFSIYPNPSNGDIINLNFSSIDVRKGQVIIYDVTGRALYNSSLPENSPSNLFTLNLAGLSSGMYFVTLTIDGYSFSKKVIKN